MLIALCDEWAGRGWLAIRYNLPYRRRRPKGPAVGIRGRRPAGIAEALTAVRGLGAGPLIAGGHSWRPAHLDAGGRAARHRRRTDAVLLRRCTHRKPDRLRTEHFGSITVPTVFTQGSSDPFGTLDELRAAAALIPGRRRSSRSAASDMTWVPAKDQSPRCCGTGRRRRAEVRSDALTPVPSVPCPSRTTTSSSSEPASGASAPRFS